MTRLLIVTGVRLYREGLAAVLGALPGLDVVGVAADPVEALPVLVHEAPDVVLLDVPVESAAAAVREVVSIVAHARIVALGVHEVEDDVVAWAEAGAGGYVSRDCSVEELVETLEAVARGELHCPASIAGALLRHVGRLAAVAGGGPPPSLAHRLTAREAEIVELMARGLSNKQIARSLDIALPTVKNHVRNIFEKLEVHRRADALLRLGRRVPPIVV